MSHLEAYEYHNNDQIRALAHELLDTYFCIEENGVSLLFIFFSLCRTCIGKCRAGCYFKYVVPWDFIPKTKKLVLRFHSSLQRKKSAA